MIQENFQLLLIIVVILRHTSMSSVKSIYLFPPVYPPLQKNKIQQTNVSSKTTLIDTSPHRKLHLDIQISDNFDSIRIIIQ